MYLIEQFGNQTQSNTTRSIAEPNRTPLVRLPNSIEHNRTHNKILPIEHNRTFDHQTIGNRTQTNVRIPNSCSIAQF